MATYVSRETKSKGTVWDARFRVTEKGESKQVKLSGFSSKREAEKAVKEYLKEREETAKKEAEEKDELNFNQVYEKYMEARGSIMSYTCLAHTKSVFRDKVLPIFGQRCVTDVTRVDVIEWQERIFAESNPRTGEPYSRRTLKFDTTLFRSFMDWASEKYGFSNPFDGVKLPRRRENEKEMQVWTAREFDAFLTAVEDPVYRMMFELLFYTGARRGEILALTVDDVVKKGGRFIIKISKSAWRAVGCRGTTIVPTKNASSIRTVELPDCLTEELGEYLIGKEGYLFGGEKPVGTTTIQRAFDGAVERSGVKHIRIHDLRHTHASILIAAGVPVTMVAKRLGHSSPAVTLKVYSHWFDSSDGGAAAVFDKKKTGKD